MFIMTNTTIIYLSVNKQIKVAGYIFLRKQLLKI